MKTLQLNVFINRQPELDDDHARITELLFKIVDFTVGAQPVRLCAKTFDALDQHAPIPGTVKHRELAAGRNFSPKTPEVRLRPLIFSGRCDRHNAVLTRVQRCGHAPDRATLAGRVIAFKHRDQGMTAHTLVTHQPRQTRLLSDQLFLIVVFFQAPGHVQTVKQTQAINDLGQRRSTAGTRFRFGCVERRLQPFEQDFADCQAAVIRVDTFHNVPGGVVATGAANYTLTKSYKAVVSF